MRELMQTAARFGNPNPLQPVDHDLLGFFALDVFMARQCLCHLTTNTHMWRQGCQRVLKDHRHPRAAHIIQCVSRQPNHLGPVKLDRDGWAVAKRTE